MKQIRAGRTAHSQPLVAHTYHVSYQLKRANLWLGRIRTHYFVRASRRFCTDELPIILAELYEEVGPAPDLLGLEILAVRPL